MIKRRNATDRDIKLVASICRDEIKLYDSIMPGSFERHAQRFEANGFPDWYDIRIIEANDNNVGFEATMKLNHDTVFLIGLYFLVGYQRNGFGTKVLESLIIESISQGFKRILLLVHKNADWAVNFYLKNGFSVVAKSLEDAIVFEKDLEDYYIANTWLMSYELEQIQM